MSSQYAQHGEFEIRVFFPISSYLLQNQSRSNSEYIQTEERRRIADAEASSQQSTRSKVDFFANFPTIATVIFTSWRELEYSSTSV